jgi:hypothetical protein
MAESLVETCWRVRARSGYEFRCELYRVGDQVAVRVSYDGDKVVHAESTNGIDAARQLAQAWLRKVTVLQEFQEFS